MRTTYNPDAPPGFENVPVQTWLYQDCRSDTQTKCRLGPANIQHGLIVSMGDRDWYGVTLRKGVRYRLTIATSGGQASLTLRSPDGKLLVRHIAPDGGTAFIDYKAPSAGTYFAAVSLVTQANIHYDLSVNAAEPPDTPDRLRDPSHGALVSTGMRSPSSVPPRSGASRGSGRCRSAPARACRTAAASAWRRR